MRPARYGRRVGPALVTLTLAVGLAGCGGGDQPAAQTGPQAMAGSPAEAVAVPALPVEAFEQRMKATKGKVVNVHVPDEGEIPGTDVHINYLSIAVSGQLPADKSTELLLYCRSGRMSAEAGAALAAAGWTNVAELAGGFEAWRASGRAFTPAPA